MIHLVALTMCIVGFAALALASERPQDDVFGHPLPLRCTQALRLAGWSFLVAAGLFLVRYQGWGMGLVSYSGHTSLAAGVVFGILVVQLRVRRHRR
jgi:hypothetical protein